MCPPCIAPNGVSLSRMVKTRDCLPRHRDRAWDVLEQMFVLWKEVGESCPKHQRILIPDTAFPCVFRFNCWGGLNWCSLHTCLKWCPKLKGFFLVHSLPKNAPLPKFLQKKGICIPHPKHSQTRIHSTKIQVQCGFCLHVPLILQRHRFQLQFSQLLGTFGVRSRCEWYRAGQRLWFGECFGKAVGMFAFGLHQFLGWRKKNTGRAQVFVGSFWL